MSLPIKKIYIDTKYKTKDSVSNSHFKIELPQTLLKPENTVFTLTISVFLIHGTHWQLVLMINFTFI